MERRLAAILAADVVGYSRLMAADEEGTLGRLRTLRLELFDPTISKHHGRLVKLMGDGALVEFASVVDAVRCAVDLQRSMTDHDLGLPEEQRIRFRVGVNLGDVIVDGDDIYGDGVNIAVRLEGLADPGGIMISGTAFDHAKKAEAGFRYIGRQHVKNIPEPVRAYQVLLAEEAVGSIVDAAPPATRARRRWSILAAVFAVLVIAAGILAWLRPWQGTDQVIPETAMLNTRRVAVLPFANISADPEDAYFADGMTEELISRLSRIAELGVIARTSTMRYKDTEKGIDQIGRELSVGTVLEGSVRKVGDRVRITAQLIDVAGQQHLWSADYDRDLEDVFAIQSEIADAVSKALRVTLLAGAADRSMATGTRNMETYTLYLKGRHLLGQRTKDSVERAKRHFEEAIALDPDYAPAYAGLALVFNELTWVAFSPPSETFPKAKAMAERALALNSNLPDAWVALALAEIDYFWHWDAGEQALKRAIEIDPSHAVAHDTYGHRILSAVRGRYDEAIAEMRLAASLDPLSLSTHNRLGMVYLHARRYDDAIREFRQTIETWPSYVFPHIGLGWAYSSKGMHDQAIAELAKAAELSNRSSYVLGHLAEAYARASRRDEALALVSELRERANTEPVTAAAFFAAYRGLGDTDQAMRWLEQMYEERHPEIIYLKDSHNDPLRSDPRFREMLTRLRLESST